MRVLLLVLTTLSISAARSETIRFDHAIPGKLPADWTVAMTMLERRRAGKSFGMNRRPAHQMC